MVEGGQLAQLVHRGDHPAAPLLLAEPFPGLVAKLILVGLALVEGMVRELQVGTELALEEDRRAEAGPESNDHLYPLTPDRRESLHVGVVDHPHRLSQPLGERAGEIEAAEGLVTEVRGGADHSASHDTGEADRHTIEGWQWLRQVG